MMCQPLHSDVLLLPRPPSALTFPACAFHFNSTPSFTPSNPPHPVRPSLLADAHHPGASASAFTLTRALAGVRRKTVDTVCDIANQGMMRGRPWHALQAQSFSMAQAQGEGGGAIGGEMRESAYRVFAGCPNLVVDLQMDAVLAVFQRGLQDGYSVQVCVDLYVA